MLHSCQRDSQASQLHVVFWGQLPWLTQRRPADLRLPQPGCIRGSRGLAPEYGELPCKREVYVPHGVPFLGGLKMTRRRECGSGSVGTLSSSHPSASARFLFLNRCQCAPVPCLVSCEGIFVNSLSHKFSYNTPTNKLSGGEPVSVPVRASPRPCRASAL